MWLYQSSFSSLLCLSVGVTYHIFAFSNDVALNKLHGYFCSAGHYLQSSVQRVSLPAWQINAHAVLLGVANFPSSKLYPQLLENICFLKVKVCVHLEFITDEDWRQRMMYLRWHGSLGAKLELRSSSPESPPLSLLPASSENWEWVLLARDVRGPEGVTGRWMWCGWWGCVLFPLLGLSNLALELPDDLREV